MKKERNKQEINKIKNGKRKKDLWRCCKKA